MDELKSSVDADTWKKLEAAKIDNKSLIMLTNEDMIDLGLELGPRKIIQGVIGRLVASMPGTYTISYQEQLYEVNCGASTSASITPPSLASCTTSASITPSSSPSCTTNVRTILEQEPLFRGILYNKLLAGVVPKRPEICYMVRLLCNSRFSERIFVNNEYPGRQEKHQLALDIVQAFPHLLSTRPYKLAPPEAAFFWRNSGKGPGKGTKHRHTGWIETRVNNMGKKLPKDQRRFNRTPNPAPHVDNASFEKAKLCAALAANTDNIKRIGDLMTETFDYHEQLLFTKSSPTCILDIFPHLCSFSGIILQKAFERLTKVNPKADIRQTLVKCLYLNNQSFPDVEDKIIRGAIRAMSHLTTRGTKNENGDPNRTAVECVASPLIKWIKPVEGWSNALPPGEHPYIICLATAPKQGEYYVNLYGKIMFCGQQATQAIDVLVKSFTVLGTTVPPGLAKFVDFVEISTFQTSSFSTRAKVNALCAMFKEIDEEPEDSASSD